MMTLLPESSFIKSVIAEAKSPKKANTAEGTHSWLVKIAERWLINTRRCAFALTELVSNNISGEIPDSIGFRNEGSILVECKISRADFLSDKNKLFRKKPEMGMGAYRFILCPAGVINSKDLPEKWGLLWANEKGKVRMIEGPQGNVWSSNGKSFFFPERDLQAEWFLMASALRRVHLRGDLSKMYD